MSITHASFPVRLIRSGLIAISWACLSTSLPAAELIQRTAIETRLLTSISTYRAKPGMEIVAALATPLCTDGVRVLPEGTKLRGVVRGVHKVGLGLVHETASLKLEFTQLDLPDGREYGVAARLAGIDNARERVDRKGNIHGIRATATISNRLAERIGFAVFAHPASMIPLFVLESTMFPFPDPEIQFQRGTALQFDVEFPAEFGELARCRPPEVETSPEEWAAIQQIVDALPYWAYSKQQRPLDLVNLVFVGSRDEVDRAFAAAGWVGSRATSMHAGLTVIRALVAKDGFPEAPMRTLLLDGREPDLRLQRSLNTFEKRDHLRIWRRDGALAGRPVWASAATRDLGITFGTHPFGPTHKIQDNVDLERDKVVHDLLFSGCVSSVSYVQRPEGVRETVQNYRKGVSTDERVAVVTLNGCTRWREDFDAEPLPKPSRLVRVVRQVTLTARNRLIRANTVYRTADAIRLSYLALRKTKRGWQAGQLQTELNRARSVESH